MSSARPLGGVRRHAKPMSELLLACATGSTETVMMVIDHSETFMSEHLVERDSTGKTPLHLAARSGNIVCVEILLSRLSDHEEHIGPLITHILDRDGQKRTAVHLAAMNDHSDVVEYLLHSIMDADRRILLAVRDGDENTPLHLACMCGSISSAEQMICYTDLTLANENGFSPLHLACLNDHHPIAALLLNSGADPSALVSAVDMHHRTALHAAASVCSIECCELLLEKGALMTDKDRRGRTALMWAVSSKNNFSRFEQCVDLFVKHGADVHQCDTDGRSALYHAASVGRKDMVEYLVNIKPDCTPEPGADGRSLLHAAAERFQGSSEAFAFIFKMFLAKGDADPLEILSKKDKGGHTPLHLAAGCGSASIISFILESCGDQAMELLDAKDKMGRTPLHYAAKHNEVIAATLLVEAGASVAVADRGGFTIAHMAARVGSIAILELAKQSVRASHFRMKVIQSKERRNGLMPHHLAACENKCKCLEWFIENKAPINFVDKTGKLALHYAARNGAEEAVRLLVMHGESPTRPDRVHGFTALLAAALGNHSSVVNFLLENGCSIADQDKHGRNLFHYAVIMNQPHNLVKLAARGADVNCRDKEGATPLHLACFMNLLHCTKDLLELDGDIKAVDNVGRNAVHYAALGGSVACLDFLLDRGGEASLADARGRTVLDAVAAGGDDEGNLACLTRLLARINPDCADNNGRLPIHTAAFHGHVEMCRNFIHFYGAAKQDIYKATPMHHLVRGCGHVEDDADMDTPELKARLAIAELLILNGGSLLAKDANGVTPVMLAAYYNVVPMCELFEKHATSEKPVYDNVGRDAAHYQEMGARKREDVKKESKEMKERRRKVREEQEVLIEEELRERTAAAAADVTPEHVASLRESVIEMREQNKLLRATEHVLRQQLKEADSRARVAEAKLSKMDTRCKLLSAQLRALREGDLYGDNDDE